MDLYGIERLHAVTCTDLYLEVGANVTFTSLIEKCRQVGATTPGFIYLKDVLASYLEKVASTPIRNVKRSVNVNFCRNYLYQGLYEQ